MPELLRIENIKKNYGDINAVNGISFAIDCGVCFGLLGPNGAGKTTTIEMIEGITPPSSGEIFYKDKKRSKRYKEEIGIQFQNTSLLSSLTVFETLQTFQKLYNHVYDLEEAIALCHLSDIVNRDNDKLSGGQRQRLLLALALINKPELIFLDEPTTGMDPQSRRNFWDIIEDIKKQGKTIILTTHYMEEAEFLCDQIAIMDHGRIIAEGSAENLIKSHCENSSVIIPQKNIKNKLAALSFEYQTVKNNIEIHTDDVNKCLKHLLSLDVTLSEMTVRSPNLEDVFLKLTGRKLRE